jgi:uncharacterized protein (TIGR01777 family)
MNLLITGGTGFIGSALCSRLLEDNHNIVVLSRSPKTIKAPIQGVREIKQLKNDTVFDVVINLAGQPIADKRWSNRQKQRVLNSRIGTTQNLIAYLKRLEHKPKLFVSGSAIGYYGISQTDEEIDETAPGDNSFSSQLCQQWETIALGAQDLGIRTCLLRTGIVLGKGGGALGKMLPLFKKGLGGRIGQGKQWMSWIHLDDLVGIILHCIEHDSLHGAINGTSPVPVTNQVFTTTLGKVLKRPTFFPMPTMLVKLLFGEMGEELLLAGKKIMPVKVCNTGYQFKFLTLDEALWDVAG